MKDKNKGFEIMRLHKNGIKPYPEVRGEVEKTEGLRLKDIAILRVWLSGEVYSYCHKRGVPTIRAGEEVILSCDEDNPYEILGIQVISGDKCTFRDSKGLPWVARK